MILSVNRCVQSVKPLSLVRCVSCIVGRRERRSKSKQEMSVLSVLLYSCVLAVSSLIGSVHAGSIANCVSPDGKYDASYVAGVDIPGTDGSYNYRTYFTQPTILSLCQSLTSFPFLVCRTPILWCNDRIVVRSDRCFILSVHDRHTTTTVSLFVKVGWNGCVESVHRSEKLPA